MAESGKFLIAGATACDGQENASYFVQLFAMIKRMPDIWCNCWIKIMPDVWCSCW